MSDEPLSDEQLDWKTLAGKQLQAFDDIIRYLTALRASNIVELDEKIISIIAYARAARDNLVAEGTALSKPKEKGKMSDKSRELVNPVWAQAELLRLGKKLEAIIELVEDAQSVIDCTLQDLIKDYNSLWDESQAAREEPGE